MEVDSGTSAPAGTHRKGAMSTIDHVVLGVRDPLVAAQWLRDEFGLGTVVGGMHPHGTANWIVPLRDGQYLELLYVVDRERMSRDEESRRLVRRVDGGDTFVSWAMRGADLTEVVDRFGYARQKGEATLPDGRVSRWNAAFHAETPRGVPYFIEYADPAERRERKAAELARAGHERPVGCIAGVELNVDRRCAHLVGEVAPDAPVRFVAGDRDCIVAVDVEIAGDVVRIAPR
jgi:hypothetical protein